MKIQLISVVLSSASFCWSMKITLILR